MVIDKIYFQIKYLLLEYDEIMEIDKEYMSTFLEECIEALKLKTDDFEDTNKNIGENDTISGCDKTDKNTIVKELYKKLAKKLHPDKNKSTEEEFLKVSKAYETEDIITLFLMSYENNINIDKLTEETLGYIKEKIKQKEEEINAIKSAIHWQWNETTDQEVRHNIRIYLMNKM